MPVTHMSRPSRATFLVSSCVAALALGVRYAGAQQEGRSIFAAVDAAGRRVSPGEEVAGELSMADLLGFEGRIQVWVLEAEPGKHVRVDLRSRAFDPYLRVVGPGFGSGLTDDDGGEGLNARLCFAVPAGGETRVIASAVSDGTGGYRLAVAEVPPEVCEAPSEARDPEALVPAGELTVGETREGTLSESDQRLYGARAQAWTLRGTPGMRVTVDLRSTDFDAYLTIVGPGLGTLTDDDGGGRCDARITFTFPTGGDYRVVVSTLGVGSGSFTLSASPEARPASEGSCVTSMPRERRREERGALDEVPILGEIPVEGGVNGILKGNERLFRGSPVQGWTVRGEAGQRLAVTMTSDEMDSYLYFDGPGFADLLYDDDGGGGLNARVCVQLPESGTFRVFPGRLSASGMGRAYRLEVTAAGAEAACSTFHLSERSVAAALLALDPGDRSIQVGQTVDSEFTDADARHPSNGTRVEAWRLVASPGATVWIDMLSDAFDPILRVVGPSLPIAESDDFSEGWNSRLQVTVPADGHVLIIAGAYSAEGRGAFRLRVSTQPYPLEVNRRGPNARLAPAFAHVPADILDVLVLDPTRVVPLGSEVEGSLTEDDPVLTNGHRAQAWMFRGEAGDEVVFEAVSDSFDPVIYVAGPGVGNPLTDDDSGGGLNARVVLVLPESGTYTVAVASPMDRRGWFRIRVLRRIRAE